VVNSFVGVVGDKLVTELTIEDAIDFRNFWRDRVVQEGIAAKTANREIGQLSGMIKELNILRRLGLPELFKGLRLKGEVDKEPTPYDTKFVQDRLLADGALDGLNEDARYIIYVIADTGLRPSEVVNLNRKTIHLNAKIPYVSVLPDGRRLKTDDSLREIPLVGVALAALKMRPRASLAIVIIPPRSRLLPTSFCSKTDCVRQKTTLFTRSGIASKIGSLQSKLRIA